MVQNCVPRFRRNVCLTVAAAAGKMSSRDGCIRAMCDDTVQMFTAGWRPGMLHSSGDTNQASIVGSSVIAVFWQKAPFTQWDAGSASSAVSKIMIGDRNMLVP